MVSGRFRTLSKIVICSLKYLIAILIIIILSMKGLICIGSILVSTVWFVVITSVSVYFLCIHLIKSVTIFTQAQPILHLARGAASHWFHWCYMTSSIIVVIKWSTTVLTLIHNLHTAWLLVLEGISLKHELLDLYFFQFAFLNLQLSICLFKLLFQTL